MFVVISLALLFISIVFMVLTVKGTRRMERVQVLKLLAMLMRRGTPIERAMSEIGARGLGGESKLCTKLAQRFSAGAPLDEALAVLILRDERDVEMLRLAMRHGKAGETLALLATQMADEDRRYSSAKLVVFYPIVIGVLLVTQSTLLWTFVMPKWEQLFKEMQLDGPFANHMDALVPCALLLVGWGILLVMLSTRSGSRNFWYGTPVLGTHLRMQENARIAGLLGLALSAGSTLEEGLEALLEAGRPSHVRRALRQIADEVRAGIAPLESFRSHGHWREEFLWGLEAVLRGAPPAATLGQVSEVLDLKAVQRLNALCRFGTPIFLLIGAAGVGLASWTVFNAMRGIAEGLLTW